MKYIYLLGLIFCLSCVTAKVNHLPKSSSEIDFDKISLVNDRKSKIWTNETSSQFYIEIPVTNDSLLLESIINHSFRKNGYKKGFLDVKNQTFSAQRGMRANEWATFTRLFYKINQRNTQLYIQSEIAQDGTGGWRENRAKKIAVAIQEYFLDNQTEL
jgi:hypothetical protein